ncbi:MAG: immunoglobulin domain-containing protein, partial [Prosthecobacter sp.]|nr:immunoglobulin domain-containing protein [Prosthecobacter sp.]
QWMTGLTKVAGATKSSYTITKAALSHAGAYTCAVKSGATTVTSGIAEIGVVDTTPKTANLAVGGTFKPAVSAAGNGLTYLWNSGQTTPTFQIKPVAVSDAGLYTCAVTGAAGVFTGGAPTLLSVSAAAPQLVKPLVLPAATIGEFYFYQIPVAVVGGAPALTYSVTGLPAGMAFNKNTGVINGRPTASKPAGHPLTIKATNTKGSDSATATLIVNLMPPTAVGVFAGPAGLSPLNDNLGGRFDLTTTATGAFSGSVTLGAYAKLSFTAKLLQSAGAGDVILHGNIPGLTTIDKTPLTAYVEVFVAEQLARLTLVHPNGNMLVIPAWRNPWNTKTKPATAYAAYYTVRLDPTNTSNPPRGYGFASFTVKPDGTLTLAGKLPDGSAITGGTFLGNGGQILLFNLLYAKRGSHFGQFTITPGTPVANNVVNGTPTWFKPGPLSNSTDTIYKDGFGPITVTVEGSPYIAPAKGQRVLGLAAVASPNTNAKLAFTLGGLDVEGKEFSQLLRITNPSATSLTNTATIGAPVTNATKMTTLDAAKGLFSGSFTIAGATTALNRPAPFFGQIVQIGGVTQGYGYHLLPTVPVPPLKVTTSPKLSGRVVLGTP